ncbi:MAG: ATP-binding cassette domain-containing protein [Xanthobacteraceae bacterium]
MSAVAAATRSLQPGSTARGIRVDAIGLGKTINRGKQALLREISLSFRPSELIAIVGASGAGKSTLLDALTGFRQATSGTVLINGQDLYTQPAARDALGYVPQDDIVHRQLTVERALRYNARLRLPDDTSDDEIERRVQEALAEVELADRRDVAIDRLSGGQRKRVSIAVELVSRPQLLYLDEPTSGLDPGLDRQLMMLLRRLADDGRTVVLTTHATSNIAICDKVVFLGRGGRLCFFGAPQEAHHFFGVSTFAEIYAALEHDTRAAAEWEERYRVSPYYSRYIGTRIAEHLLATDGRITARTVEPKDSAWRQFQTLTRRYLRLLWSDKPTLAYLIGQAPLMALFLAMVSGAEVFRLGQPFANAQVALTLLMIFNLWIGANTACREIVKERPIYRRERLANLRIGPYVASKVVVLAILNLFQTVLYVGVFELWSGAPANGVFLPAWLELMLTIWITGIVGSAMALFISAAAANLDLALSITPSSIIPQMLLAGALFALPAQVDVLGHAMIAKPAINALGTTADLNAMYYASAADLPDTPKVTALLGQVVFNPHSYDDNPGPKTPEAARGSRRQHLLKQWGVLAAWELLFVGLTCLTLKRKDRTWNERRRVKQGTRPAGRLGSTSADRPLIGTTS